jgi:hypothetical protein
MLSNITFRKLTIVGTYLMYNIDSISYLKLTLTSQIPEYIFYAILDIIYAILIPWIFS